MRLNQQGFFGPIHVKTLFLVAIFLIAGRPAQAQYATGGSSPYKNDVLWLTWGGGPNGTDNQPLNNGDQSSASIQVSASQTLTVTCSLSNITHSGGGTQQLTSYRPGDYSGDVLDNLYNIGGTGGSNQLVNGISRDGGVSNFTIACTADINGQPFNLRGLVMADAESLNNTGEYVEATAAGAWNVVEMQKNMGAGSYSAQKTNTGSTQTIRFGPGTDDNTAAVTFLSFDNPSANVSMNFSMRGGGVTAVAIGLLSPYSDFSDAPATYGDASHVVQNLTFQPDNVPAGSQVNLNDPGYQPGGLAPPNTDYLGSEGPDTEPGSKNSADATGDDIYRRGNNNEEDAWPQNYTISVLQQGETLSQPVTCTGTGTVAGWIDFNRNNDFESAERAESPCSGGSANLSWTISQDLTAGTTFVRLRYATDATEILSPYNLAYDGEVEDTQIEVTSPELSVTKSSNATNGEWSVQEDDAIYTLAVTNNGPVATGDPANGISAETVTVVDQLSANIQPDWTGTYTNNGWSCTVSGQDLYLRPSDRGFRATE